MNFDRSVAVVVPCYNAQLWISRALKSVTNQSLRPTELIFVDDGSRDCSVSAVEALDIEVKLIKSENRGACWARNRGLFEVTSKYLFFLDADDYVEGDFLLSSIDTMSATGADVCFSQLWIEKPNGSRTLVNNFNVALSAHDVFGGWLDKYSQPPCSIVWRTDFIRSIGGWDTRVLKNQDGELVMRSMLHLPLICHADGGRGVYNAHTMPSISKSKDAISIRSEFESYLRLLDLSKGTSFEASNKGFARSLYMVAQAAFLCGDSNLGRSSLSCAKSLGQTGHVGTLLHQVVCTLLGLERKTIFARYISRLKKAIFSK